jgi:C4-dicarboxylate transporter, DctM subunit
MAPWLIGIIGLVVLFLFLFVVRLPVGTGMALIGFIGIWYLLSPDAAITKLASIPFNIVSNYSMIVMFLFALMANIITYVGFGSSLYTAASKWLGRLPGGLAVATIGGEGVLGAVSPGSMASLFIMGNMAYPEMKKYGYSSTLSTGCIAAGASLGSLIPPSGGMIIYGIMTGQSIGKLFMAGLIPGVVLCVMFVLLILFMCLRNAKLGPRVTTHTSFKDRIVSIGACAEIILLIFLILGGILFGWFTPTEAGAIGAFGAIIFAFARKKLTRQSLMQSFVESFKMTGAIYLILIGAFVFSAFMSVSQLPFQLNNLISSLTISPLAIIGVMMIIYLILGCIMDTSAMITLTIPIFYPIVTSLGFSPIWFGVIVIMVVEMGAITPPVAMNIWILSAVIKKEPLGTIYRGIIPFLAVEVVLVVLLLFVPQIATFLPGIMK